MIFPFWMTEATRLKILTLEWEYLHGKTFVDKVIAYARERPITIEQAYERFLPIWVIDNNE